MRFSPVATVTSAMAAGDTEVSMIAIAFPSAVQLALGELT